MSFILDALKKSETDRQRQNGPVLFEVKVAPPRNGLPLWAVGLAVLLAVNLVIVAWVLLRRPDSTEVATVGASQPTAPTLSGAATVARMPASVPTASTADMPQRQTAPPTAVPVSGTAPGAPVGQTAVFTQSPASQTSPGGSDPRQPVSENVTPGGVNGPMPAQADTASEKPNPDDYAPATDPPPTPAFGNHVARGTSSGLPLYQDAALAPGAHIPDLRLDLHVFAAKPQERFVMINMHKLREGDSLPEGVRVESITPEGAVLSHDGTKFLLPRD